MWNRREFRIRLGENTVREYEKVMLTSGECGFFMPMVFLGEDGGEVACYDCSGFAPISGFRIERTEDALYILECVLLMVGKSVEYLITPAKIIINTDTVFYNKETGEVKIAYVPTQIRQASLRRNLVAFIKQLKKDIRDGKDRYLVDAARYLLYHNYSVRELVDKIGLFKRQIYTEGKQNNS